MNLPHNRPKYRAKLLVVSVLLALAAALSVYSVESFLTVNEAPRQSDAIVVLLGGSRPERIEKAYELLSGGYAPKIIFGSGYHKLDMHFFSEPLHAWIPAGERYRQFLESKGINSAKIDVVSTPEAFDTESELFPIIQHLQSVGVHSVLLVTSVSHTNRARWIWSRLAPSISVTTVAAPNAQLQSWWLSRAGYATVIHELFGYMKEAGRRIGLLPYLDFPAEDFSTEEQPL